MEAADLGDDFGGGRYRVDAAVGRARMPLMPDDAGAEERAALLRIGDLHRGRLADDRQHRPRDAGRQRADQRRGAKAAGLLIMGEGEMQRHLERALRHLRHQRQDERDKALHVGTAAAIEPAALLSGALGENERVAVPFLPGDRHDIGMPREDDATPFDRSDRREQIGLAPQIIERERRRRAERFQIGPRPLDQREVGFTTRSVESDPLPDQRKSNERIDVDTSVRPSRTLSHEGIHRWRVPSIHSIVRYS